MQRTKLFRVKSIPDILSDIQSHGGDGHSQGSMTRTLGVWDLTALGIAALVGAGIFATVGTAAANGGPAVAFLFIFTAIACGFSAFCYAEFASALPISGSAYTYAYASLGELIAWIIGWDLLMEYAIGNIAVAISWSDYFTSLLAGYGIHFPDYLSMDFLTASRGHSAVQEFLSQGLALADLAAQGVSQSTLEAFYAWQDAPRIWGIPFICDVPAVCITILVTWIVFMGIRESKIVNNLMVLLKVGVLLLVIGLGAFYIKPENWEPFAPNGIGGVLKGVSGVFFAYIGFDAISTTAEECKNPQKDLPRAMIYSLIICTILYVLVSLVLTGLVSYKNLAVGDPLAFAFGPQGANIGWVSGLIAISAVVALFTVLLVFQLGQPRIWMVMSRDGLLPKIFSSLHPKHKTPWFSTIVAGLFVGIPCLFMNLTEVTDLTSIGTLFAFLLVCAGVLRLDPNRPKEQGKFRTPYINAKYILPALLIITVILAFIFNKDGILNFWSSQDPTNPAISGWEVNKHKIPFAGYCIGMLYLTYLTFKKNFSLIPVLGLVSCGYLISELGWTNWVRFIGWLILGLIIYFFYGYKNSRLSKESSH